MHVISRTVQYVFDMVILVCCALYFVLVIKKAKINYKLALFPSLEMVLTSTTGT
jgi:hypothetical protein